jgi:hypothetical protein
MAEPLKDCVGQHPADENLFSGVGTSARYFHAGRRQTQRPGQQCNDGPIGSAGFGRFRHRDLDPIAVLANDAVLGRPRHDLDGQSDSVATHKQPDGHIVYIDRLPVYFLWKLQHRFLTCLR